MANRSPIRIPLLFVLVAAVIGLLFWLNSARTSKIENTQIVVQIIDSEEIILELQRELSQLSAGAMNHRIPDIASQHLFSSTVHIKDLANSSDSKTTSPFLDIEESYWPISAMASDVEHENIAVLGPLLDQMSYLESFSIKVVKGHHQDDRFVTKLLLNGSGKSQTQKWNKHRTCIPGSLRS